MEELVTESLEGYERKALELARCPEALRTLRRRLEEQRGSAPLFDTARFTRHLEAAYQVMHERALRGDPPVGFSVRPADGPQPVPPSVDGFLGGILMARIPGR
jgi:hypothetical protein